MEKGFVHKQGIFCGRGGEIVAACPHRGCLVWMYGARRWHLSTDGGVFVDAEENSCRLSTQRVPGVDVWCQQVAFVHGWGRFCGRGGE